MKSLPKIHKKEINLRLFWRDCKSKWLSSSRFQGEGKEKKKMIKNNEDVIREWSEGKMEQDKIIFSLDVKKMYTNFKKREDIGRTWESIILLGGN